MYAAWQPPKDLGRHYFCPWCDVYGRGDECWVCGSDVLTWGRMPAVCNAARAPHYDAPEPPPFQLTGWHFDPTSGEYVALV